MAELKPLPAGNDEERILEAKLTPAETARVLKLARQLKGMGFGSVEITAQNGKFLRVFRKFGNMFSDEEIKEPKNRGD